MSAAAVARVPLIRLYDDEECIDGFAGGGGTSTGIEWALGRAPGLAINHDPEALAMHRANHPNTKHLLSNIREVSYKRELRGKRCAFAWFSPDCTFHSKARGGKPFRDRDRARRIRGLAWEAVRCAKEVQPRVIFLENVEEFQDWCPLGKDGRPDPEKRGASFRRWVARLTNMGYVVEWRQLRAQDFGAPTSRKRLFVIARRDGQPITWPKPTHGPTRASAYRTAAECINFALPVPSIFLTPREAKQWAQENGCETPRRPLAEATLRRIARGIMRYVVESPAPFVVDAGALVAPTLIQTSYGERKGQKPRTLDLFEPLGTVVAGGIKHSLVTAFLAKHNGGHEATGQALSKSMDVVTCKDTKALVCAHLTKFYGTANGQQLDLPMPTTTAQGNHLGLVSAFLLKYYGTKADGCVLTNPLDTITTKGRYGLVTITIAGEQYAIVDIGMRMLTPRELFKAQGFPDAYHIEQGIDVKSGRVVRFTKKSQTRLVGNSVPPHLSAALLSANLGAA